MGRPYAGGCACGAIRYEITGEPVVGVDCQCRQCQRESGNGHASHLTFQGAAVTVSGEAARWSQFGDGGIEKRRAFCPTCGSPVYMTFPAMTDVFVVRAGSLDEPGRYRADIVTWTASAPAWDLVDPAIPKFERMPPRSAE